jgi:CBS domain containing-hemolysin-like protein
MMTIRFNPVPMAPLDSLVSFFRPRQELPDKVAPHSPAILVMTDFRQVPAITVEPGVSIEWALQRMKECGVRMLLVTNPQQQVLGLITTTDIQGEKPMTLGTEYNRRFAEITVREVMTPYEHLDVIAMESVLKASVGEVVDTMRRVGRRHALVLDFDRHSQSNAIRGMFSFSQICRQLGQPMEDMVEVATTFADMEIALNG